MYIQLAGPLTSGTQAILDQQRMVRELYARGVPEDAIMTAQERGFAAIEALWSGKSTGGTRSGPNPAIIIAILAVTGIGGLLLSQMR